MADKNSKSNNITYEIDFYSPFKRVMDDKSLTLKGDEKGNKSSKDDDDIIIEGIAVTNDPIEDKKIIFNNSVLRGVVKNADPRAKILIDHQLSSTNVVGRLLSLELSPTGDKVFFRASINPNHPSGVGEAIKRGDIDAVSIGGYVREDELLCSICGNPINSDECNHFIGQTYNGVVNYGQVSNYHLRELSLTAFPAVRNASIQSISFSDAVNLSKLDTLLSISSSVRNSLPDSSFAIPSERKLPYKDKNGKIMCDWVRNALKLAPKVKGGVPSTAMSKLLSAARKCGISSEKFKNPSNNSTLEGNRMSGEMLEKEAEKIKSVEGKQTFNGEREAKMAEEYNMTMSDNKMKNGEMTEGQIKVLEAMINKLKKDNEEMAIQLSKQREFIEKQKEEERRAKIEELIELTGIEEEEIMNFSEEVLDAQLMIARKYAEKEKKKNKSNSGIGDYYLMNNSNNRVTGSVRQPTIYETEEEKEARKEKIKSLIRMVFDLDEPSETAKEKVQWLMMNNQNNRGRWV